MIESALVAGGGIAGMVAAIGLARRGVRVHVIEAARPEDQLGTGINLQNNALRALDEVGVLQECVVQGFGWNEIVMRDGETGEALATLAQPWPHDDSRPGALGIMRTTLAEILQRHALAAGAKITYQTKITSISQDEAGVSVELTNGESDRADVLIGADGVYSQVRKAVFPDAPKPSYIGQGVWRFTVPRPKSMDGFSLFKSSIGSTLGFLPLSQELAYYFVLETTDEPIRVPADQAAQMMAERLKHFHAPMVEDVLPCLDGSWHVSYRPFDVMFLPDAWHSGRVTLVGDAAHSLTPQLTSGAGMAIEDAVVLVDELTKDTPVKAALAAYSARRIPRASLVYRNSLIICETEKTPSADASHGPRLMVETFKELAKPY